MAINIKHPRQNDQLTGLGKYLVVSGEATSDITGITTELTAPAGSQFKRKLTQLDRNNPNKSRWRVVFQGTFAPGNYKVAVTGFRHQQSPLPPETHSFTVAAYASEKDLRSIMISYPSASSISAEEADSLIAYGVLGDEHSLVQATWGGNQADFMFDDGSYWVAQFPPLTGGPGDYTLAVFDSANHSDSKVITVT